MKRVLLSCLAIAAGATIAMAQDEPVFPSSLDYTLNGQKELAGVDVKFDEDPYAGYILSVTGESDAEEIAITLAVPEGWDGWIIYTENKNAEVSEQPIAKTRSEDDWEPLVNYLNNNWTPYLKGNTVTFVVEEEENWATLALYKGDKVYTTTINIEYNVVPAGGSTDGPVFPKSVGVTTYAEGLDEDQTNKDGQIFIELTGEIEEGTFDVILDVPEGWDGFISMIQSGDVTIGESNVGPIGPRMTRADEDDDEGWMSLEEALAAEGVQGNKFTFQANGERSHVEVYLYKGEQVYVATSITLNADVKKYVDPELEAANQAAYEGVIAQLDALEEKYEAAVAEIKETNPDFDLSMYEEIPSQIASTKLWAEQALNAANADGVPFSDYFYGSVEEIEGFITMMIMEGTPAPAIPESYDVSVSDQGVEVNQYIEQGVQMISVSGKSIKKEITLTVGVPEGWDGFVVMKEGDHDPGISPLSTRAEDPEWTQAETEWIPIEYVLEGGAEETNAITFPVDGEDHSGQFMLVKNGLVDVANHINVEFNVVNANQEAYDEVVAQIDAVQEEYDAALDALKKRYPDFDFTKWEVTIGGALEKARTDAKQALDAANEEGKEFKFTFSGDDIRASIKQMKDETLAANNVANQAAYDEVVAKIDALQDEYNEVLRVLSEQYPDYDFTEWKEMIGGALDQAKSDAKQALDAANEEDLTFDFTFDGEEIKAMIAEMNAKVPVLVANQAAYDEVAAKIDALQKEYEEALAAVTEKYPDSDFTELSEIISNALEEARSGAKQALASANEDGVDFNFAFDGEDIKGMIAELYSALTSANQAAYEEVIAKVDALRKEYEEALAAVKEKYPDYDFSEWEEIIGKALEEAASGAEQALKAANEDGVDFNFAFDGEDIKGMIAEMEASPALAYANQAAYDAVIAKIDELRKEYEEAVAEIKENNPDFDLTEWEEIIGNALEDAKAGAKQALDSANEDGEEFNFAFDGEDIEGMIAEMKASAAGSGVAGVAVDDNASYYDLNGHKINRPQAGMYIKVVDGKASKVVIK